MTKHHILKIEPAYLSSVLSGLKTFEIRKNDRGYSFGDTFVLTTGFVTSPVYQIEYITDFAQQDGYVVFSFRPFREITLLSRKFRAFLEAN
ncbi:DUF3850 domain-containing protein [Vibrio cholerae]|nr:DUF3850 domain-containing protein [Vibrio cholerae]